MTICLVCEKPCVIKCRGMCSKCYDKHRWREKTPEGRKDRNAKKGTCIDCHDPIHASSKRCTKCANLAKVKPEDEREYKPAKGSPFPVGCKVREKPGLYDKVLTGTVMACAIDDRTPVFTYEGERWVKVKLERTGAVVPLRVSTLERVFTPVDEWPATDIEDDVAAIFAEVGA